MPTDDHQLVRRSLSGERAAFGALYDRHAPRVFHLLRRLTNNMADAEDLTQETFLAAFGALAQWRGEGQFGTWLCGIAFRQYAAAGISTGDGTAGRRNGSVRAEETIHKLEAWEKSRR